MTSISSLFGSATTALTSTATVQPSDKTAFSSAISDILNGLKSGTSAATTAGTTAASTSTSTASTGTSVQDKVDGLIDNEVSAGKLTSDQATQLKGLFAKAAGHMHHIHAPKSSSSTDLASTDDDSTDALGVSTTDGTSATDPLAALTGTSATSATSGGKTVMDEATSALGGLISGIKSAAAATGIYGSGGLAHSGIGSLLIHAFA